MSNPFLAQIIRFAGNFAIRGWALCNGQLLAISSNSALFSILGTIYGGDGRTTFALPDLRGRVPMHWGNGPGLSPRAIGQKGGQQTVTLLQTEMPSHNHVVNPHYTNSPVSTSPANALPSDVGFPVYGTTATGDMGQALVGNTGGSQSHENRQPFNTLNYEIALMGVFPSRN